MISHVYPRFQTIWLFNIVQVHLDLPSRRPRQTNNPLSKGLFWSSPLKQNQVCCASLHQLQTSPSPKLPNSEKPRPSAAFPSNSGAQVLRLVINHKEIQRKQNKAHNMKETYLNLFDVYVDDNLVFFWPTHLEHQSQFVLLLDIFFKRQDIWSVNISSQQIT